MEPAVAAIYIHDAASIGLHLDGVYREDGLPWIESTEKMGYPECGLQKRWATLEGICREDGLP